MLEDGEKGVVGATPLSATGLHHWQTVLSMLSGSSQPTNLAPHTEGKIILTPLKPPPHPLEVKKWVNAKLAAKQRQIESESQKSSENDEILQEPPHHQSNQPINVSACDFHVTCLYL